MALETLEADSGKSNLKLFFYLLFLGFLCWTLLNDTDYELPAIRFVKRKMFMRHAWDTPWNHGISYDA